MSMSRDYRQMYNDHDGVRDRSEKESLEYENTEMNRVESFQTEITEKTVSKQESNFEFFSSDDDSDELTEYYGKKSSSEFACKLETFFQQIRVEQIF